jgi:hypothetical protein
MYEAAGTIKLINETQSFPSGFMKREFVVTTAHDKYPQDLKFEIVKDKCSLLDAFQPGQEVQVSFDIRGNEYNGKYFVNLSCWKIQATHGGSESSSRPSQARERVQGGQQSAPVPDGPVYDEDPDDDVPF